MESMDEVNENGRIICENDYKRQYDSVLETKIVQWDEFSTVEQIWEQMKWEVVDVARKVCAPVFLMSGSVARIWVGVFSLCALFSFCFFSLLTCLFLVLGRKRQLREPRILDVKVLLLGSFFMRTLTCPRLGGKNVYLGQIISPPRNKLSSMP